MRGIAVAVIFLLCPMVFAQDPQGYVKYLPDHVSKAHPFELRTPLLDYPLADTYGLTAAEVNPINQAMQRIADFLLAQPAVNPPRGFMTSGDMRITLSSLCKKMPCRDVPISGWVEMRFYGCIEIKGKPFCGGEFGNAIEVHINDLKPPQHLTDAQHPINDLGGPQIVLEPRNHREVHGLEVYEGEDGEFGFFVLTRSTQPYFLPVSQELYLPWLIKYWENKEAEVIAKSKKKNPYADDALYQKWLAERGERLRQNKARCEMNQQRGGSKAVDECLRNAEKMEEETGKNIQMMIAAAKKADADPQIAAGTMNYLEYVRKILARLRMQQANMTPSERREQARWDPSLLFSDNPQYRHLVMVNPAIIDRTLPRTAVQLIQVRFETDYSELEGRPEKRIAHADSLGVINLMKNAHWEELRQLLVK